MTICNLGAIIPFPPDAQGAIFSKPNDPAQLQRNIGVFCWSGSVFIVAQSGGLSFNFPERRLFGSDGLGSTRFEHFGLGAKGVWA